MVVTDLALVGSLWLVTGWFGGRTPLGHLLLSVCACVAAIAWSLHQVTSSDRHWSRLPGGGIWVAALALLLVQMWHLPIDLRTSLSPTLPEILPLWTEADAEATAQVPRDHWQTLSLAAGMTLMVGMPQLLSYGLLAFTALQRYRTQSDLEQLLRWLGIAVATWSALGLLQYWFYNGHYYWVIAPPRRLPHEYVTGPFTNRNHFAQFLALGFGPLLWSTVQAFLQDSSHGHAGRHSSHGAWQGWQKPGWIAAVIVTLLATVMTLSRGGFLSLGIVIVVSTAVLIRRLGTRHLWILGVIAAALLASGSIGIDQLQARFQRVQDVDFRQLIWESNWKLAQDFPWFGTGIGTHINTHYLHLNLPQNQSEFTHAESSVLQVASEAGFVGLCLAGLTFVLAIWGPLLVLTTSSDRSHQAIAGAVLGGLLGNAAHAFFDFIWYAPGCVIPLLLLMVIGCRVRALQREAQSGRVASRPASACGWGLATAGAALTGVLAVGLASVEAQSEYPLREYQRLTWQIPSGLEEEDLELHQQERTRFALQAAKLRPFDSRMQLAAARMSLRLFQLGMQNSDMPLSLLEIKDAARASGFETLQEQTAWVRKIAGANWKYLVAADRFAQRSLQASPLEATAYLILAQTAFLRDPTNELERRYIAQAVRLRPGDIEVRTAAGEQTLLDDNLPAALEHWSFCYRHSPRDRQKIANMLVQVFEPEPLQAALELDWDAVAPLILAYQQLGDDDRVLEMSTWQAQRAEAIALANPRGERTALQVAIDGWQRAGDHERALSVLRVGAEEFPEMRKTLGLTLLNAGQFDEAVEHLRSAASRFPHDQPLQAALKRALDKQLRQVTPVVHETAPHHR